MKRKKLLLLLLALAILAFLLIGILGSLRIQITEHTVTSANIPKSFDGFCIAQISDLHNREFGANNETLLSLLENTAPDIIVVTGDLIDSYRTNVDISVAFMEAAVKIAPCYYVSGNHEHRIPNEYARLKKAMKACGVTVLEDRSVLIRRGDAAIELAGLADRSKLSAGQFYGLLDQNSFSILLSHRPEHYSVYRELGADLIFSGHAHGGQICLPGIGALFAPGEGLFPKYADGIHTVENSTLAVSRGLGNSSFPFRFYCPPELLIVRLRSE